MYVAKLIEIIIRMKLAILTLFSKMNYLGRWVKKLI